METASARPNVRYGDADVALSNEIIRSVVGSGVHGIAIAGTDDHDEMGVYIEPPTHVLGVRDHRQDFTSRTQPEGVRSGPGDTDLVIYGLRKYLRLAMKGNPTALIPMYAPEDALLVTTELGWELRDNRHWFLSQDAVWRFLGYMRSQHERMMGGGKRNRVPSRPELIERYGWDVKYGSHALRLAHQGNEIATHGTLTLPLVEDVRQRVLAVKRGEVPQAEVSAEIASLERNVLAVLNATTCPIPAHPHGPAIESWSISAHRRMWDSKGWTW